MQDFHNSLNPLKMGNAADVDIKSVKKKFIGKELKLAEHLQFWIHEFCSKNPAVSTGADTVVTLVDLCYSSSGLPGLTNMDRFAGCLSTITSYFLQNNKLTKAMEMCELLEKKRSLLVSASVTSGAVRNSLFIIHYHLVKAAVKQQHQDTTLRLLDASLTSLHYICTADPKLASKVVRNLKHAINNLKTLPKNTIGPLLTQAKQIVDVLSGSSEGSVFEDYLTLRVCSLLSSIARSDEPVKISERLKQEIAILLRLSQLSALEKDWETVIDAFVTNECSVETGVAAAARILHCAGSEKHRRRACLLLCSLLTPERWTSCSPEDTLLLFTKFVMLLWEESLHFRQYVVEMDGGKHFCILESLARCFVTVASLCRPCLKQRVADALTLLPVASEAFRLCEACLQQMTSCDASVQTYLWSHAVIRAANSIEDLLGHCLEGDGNNWTSLRYYCRVVVPLVAGSNRELPIERRRMSLQFERWHLACTKLGELEEAMLLRALQVCTCPSDTDDAIFSWAQAKLSNAKTEKTASFFDFLKKKENELRLWKSDLAVSNMNQKELLLAEAKAYQAIGTSVADAAVKNLWSVLKTLRPTVFELAYLLSCVMMCGGQLQRECHRVLEKLAELREGSDGAVRVRCMCYEGVLKFAVFTCTARQSREEGTTHESRHVLLNLLKAEAEEKAKFGEDVDLNVTCDVAAALTVDGEASLVAALGAALTAWRPVPAAWTPDCLPPRERALTLQHLHLIGNTATLYGDVLLSVKAWVLLYRVASLAGDDVEKLWAVCMLIKVCGVSGDSLLMKTAQELAEKLQDGCQVSKLPQATLEAVLTCWLSLTQVHLKLGNYDAAAALLEKCQGAVRHIPSDAEYLMVRGEVFCYTSQLLLAAPHLATSMQTNVQHEAYRAFHHLKAALKAATDRSMSSKLQGHLLLTMLDVSTWCAELFLSLLLTPYVRAFVEDVYTLCQALRLTGRTAQLLCLLVQVDLTTRDLTEAQLKLNNLSSLLNLPPLPPPQLAQVNKSCDPSRSLQIPLSSRDVSPLRCQPSQRDVIQMPRQTAKGGACRVDTSPLPMLLHRDCGPTARHLSSCRCYVCSSVLLKLVALTARSCEALAAALAGDFFTAAVCYQHCEAALEALTGPTSTAGAHCDAARYQRDVEAELATVFSGETIPQIQRDVSAVGARVFLSYAAFSMAPDSPSSLNATRALQAADGLIAGLTFCRPLLEWSLLELHICHFLHQHNKQPVKDSGNEAVSTTTFVAKTPHVKRAPLLPESQQAAPNKCTQTETHAEQTPAARPKRGRRIFDEPPSAAKPPPLRKVHVTPATTRKPVANSAATSIRVAAPGATTRRRKVRVLLSSSDSDVPASPSPDCQAVTSAAKDKKLLKPVPLIFDESEDAEAGCDVSKDLFESFEQALKISEPEPKKSVRKKAAGSKVGRAATSAKANSCR